MSPSSDESPGAPPTEVASKMKMDYLHGAKDPTTKALEDFNPLLARIAVKEYDLNALYKECATLISRDFGLSSVCIAVWVPSAQQYRFKATCGLRSDGDSIYQKLWYTKSDMKDDRTYPYHEISAQTRLYLAEDHPFAPGQEATFMRPGLIGMKRRSVTEALEVDYVCTYFFDSKQEILGWIEYSGTRMGKLPDASTIRWVEFVAQLLGIATSLKA